MAKGFIDIMKENQEEAYIFPIYSSVDEIQTFLRQKGTEDFLYKALADFSPQLSLSHCAIPKDEIDAKTLSFINAEMAHLNIEVGNFVHFLVYPSKFPWVYTKEEQDFSNSSEMSSFIRSNFLPLKIGAPIYRPSCKNMAIVTTKSFSFERSNDWAKLLRSIFNKRMEFWSDEDIIDFYKPIFDSNFLFDANKHLRDKKKPYQLIKVESEYFVGVRRMFPWNFESEIFSRECHDIMSELKMLTESSYEQIIFY